jgi:membrane protein implicated in regulation of membrane protease activity
MDHNPRILFLSMNRQNWLQRIIVFVMAAAIAVLAFFFLTIALAAAAMIASIAALRWWWLTRKLRASPARQDTFEGEYIVIERSRLDQHATDAAPTKKHK